MRSFPPLLPVCAHRMCGKKEEEEEDIDNSRYSCKEQGGGGRSSPEEEGSFILPLSCCEHGYVYSTVQYTHGVICFCIMYLDNSFAFLFPASLVCIKQICINVAKQLAKRIRLLFELNFQQSRKTPSSEIRK